MPSGDDDTSQINSKTAVLATAVNKVVMNVKNPLLGSGYSQYPEFHGGPGGQP